MEHNILYSMWKEGVSNLVSLLSKSLEPVVDMHNNDRVICSCAIRGSLHYYSSATFITQDKRTTITLIQVVYDTW